MRAERLPADDTTRWPRPAAPALLPYAAHLTLRHAARLAASRELDVRAHGLSHIPRSGPVVLAVRHYHHLWDGVVLLATVPRRLHLLVALDWVDSTPLRRLMEWATRTAGWPALLRPEGLAGGGPSAYRDGEVARFRLRALREAVAILRAGGALVVFPEGFPTIDPRFTPKRDARAVLPFRTGFARAALLAARRLGRPVPVVPVGLQYTAGPAWRVTMRCGAPRRPTGDPASFARLMQNEVTALSGLHPPTI